MTGSGAGLAADGRGLKCALQLFFYSGAASPAALQRRAQRPSIIEQLRGCLSVENMTKERLNCYDAIVPPEPITVATKAKTVLECRFLREEDERIVCFNGFLFNRASVDPALTPKTSPYTATNTLRSAPRHPSEEKRPKNLKIENRCRLEDPSDHSYDRPLWRLWLPRRPPGYRAKRQVREPSQQRASALKLEVGGANAMDHRWRFGSRRLRRTRLGRSKKGTYCRPEKQLTH